MRSTLLWVGAYFVALVLVLTPLMDVLIAAFPFRPGEMAWRFAAIGIFAEGVMLALLGLYSALALAIYLDHRVVVKALGIISALGVVAFGVVIVVFMLDAVGMRSIIAPEARSGMAVASAAALFKHLCGFVGTGLMALTARSEVRRSGRARRSQDDIVFAAGKK